MEKTNNKTIAKNTSLLYFRMLLNMVIALFTSRVILASLGVLDFGIFQIVGGVVSLLAFLNSALSTGSERFLTYELGTGNREKLKRTFSTVLTAHIILALFIVLILETIGLWYLYNKVNIEPERMGAAVFSYHICVLASIFTITQIPYNASIISHERMSAFAYISICEALLKLLIAYLLYISPWDKLKVYSILYCGVQISIALFYRIYCLKFFEETHYSPVTDKSILKEVLSYSGLNLLDNLSVALNNQGATLILVAFFNPAVVAARAVANQANMATHQLMNNFRKAFTPQVVKLYAAGDQIRSRELLLSSTKYSYYMMLCLCFPIVMSAHKILELWLDTVPEYADLFLQVAVITSLFQSFNSSFYTALQTLGRIKENAIINLILTLQFLPITYLLFKQGYSPIAVSIVQMAIYAIISIIVKPLLISKIAAYPMKDIIMVFIPCIKVTILALILPLSYRYLIENNLQLSELSAFIYMTVLSFLSTACAIWLVGLDSDTKAKLMHFVQNKLCR